MSLAQGVVVMSVAALAIEAHRVATAVAAFQKVLAALQRSIDVRSIRSHLFLGFRPAILRAVWVLFGSISRGSIWCKEPQP